MRLSPYWRVSLSLIFVCFAPAVLAADRGEGRVELRIRVVAPYREFTRAFWNVSVTAPSGVPAEQVTETGGWAVFPKLAPATYSVCITGVRGRHRCSTVEISAPVAGSRSRRDVELEIPRSNISLSDLRRPNRPEADILAISDGGTSLGPEKTQTESDGTSTVVSAAPPKPLQPTGIR
jgi:hypothetical protein